MNKFLRPLIATLLTAISFNASHAESFPDVTKDGIIYSYNEATDYAVVKDGKSVSGAVSLPNNITFSKVVRNPQTNEDETLTKTATVKGIGSSAFSGNSEITSFTANYIESIGSRAFEKCTSLYSGSAATLTIPSTVKEIGEGAFAESGVYQVNYTSSADVSDAMFRACTNLVSITFNANIQKIGENAFWECTALGSGGTVELPTKCIEIGKSAFSRCSGMKSIILKNQLKEIGTGAFQRCSALTELSFPENYEDLTICDKAFYECSGIISIKFKNSKKISFGQQTFGKLPNLEKLYLAEGIVSLGYGNFSNCSKLKDLELEDAQMGKKPNLPSTISRIDGCFGECTSLTYVDLPAPPKNGQFVAKESFNNCDNIIFFTVEPNGNYDLNSSFQSCNSLKFASEPRPFDPNTKASKSRSISRAGGSIRLTNGSLNRCKKLESIGVDFTIGEGGGLFNCLNFVFDEYTLPYAEVVPSDAIPGYVKKAILKNTVRVLKENAIANVGEINIPDSLRVMHTYCLNIQEVTELTLPDSISEVYGCAIECPKLEKLTVLNPTPPIYHKDISFSSITHNDGNVTLYVPNGSGEAYRNADGWKDFKEIIELDKSEIDSLEGDGKVSVKVTDGRLNVTGCDRVSVYNMLGSEVYAGHPDDMSRVAPGIYIVRAGNVTAKVAL